MAQIPTGASPHIAARFRDASVGTVVVQGPGELLLFDPATNAPLRSVAVGKQPHWMAATPDGKKVFVTNEGSNDVTVVDLATRHDHDDSRSATRRARSSSSVLQRRPQRRAAVSIANFAFAPGNVTVAPGATVTWSNDDGATHGLAYKDGAKGTDVLLPGQKFSRTYDKPGSYDYVCSVHPYMRGTVTVGP